MQAITDDKHRRDTHIIRRRTLSSNARVFNGRPWSVTIHLYRNKGEWTMIIQVQGNVQFKITLDPSTWIFDDRKIDISGEKLESEDITFDDSREWNRSIIEGTSKPPTLKTEKQYKSKKEALTTGTFAICLAPFLEYTEPNAGEDAVIIFTDSASGAEVEMPYASRENLFAFFCKEGKRLHDDGMFDLLFIDGDNIDTALVHVDGIVFK